MSLSHEDKYSSSHCERPLYIYAMVGGVNSSYFEWYGDDSSCNNEGTTDDKDSRDVSEAETTVMYSDEEGSTCKTQNRN